MIQNIGYSPNITPKYQLKKNVQVQNNNLNLNSNVSFSASNPIYSRNVINTSLTQAEKEKYTFLLNYLKDVPISVNAEKMSCAKQLEHLLKNGKLLSKSSNDKSSTLDNIYAIATTSRVDGIDAKKLISNTLDILVNPRTVTQTFGDIPENYKNEILKNQKPDSLVVQNPEAMNVVASGTCAAASNEVNLADKYPAEFARWVNGLSSESKAVYLDIDMSAISKNALDAITILNLLEAKIVKFDFSKVKVEVKTDNNAYIRAKIQNDNWDKGERNIADVLIQSAIMQLGSQNTYDSLTDTRAGNFNANPQGLVEVEKTFVESLIKNRETTSLVYQKIDDEQNLIGHTCSFEKMQKHLTDTLDSGDDVIIGYVLTNETSGRCASGFYNVQTDGKPNKVINGHEITVTDYIKDDNGKVSFVCVDTDDDSNDFVKYSADWLLPKIHHAGYPAYLVEADEKEIMKNVL